MRSFYNTFNLFVAKIRDLPDLSEILCKWQDTLERNPFIAKYNGELI
jgi:hypothetical protein